MVGKILYYARTVEPNMLVVLGTLASTQSKATEDNKQAVAHFLDYYATKPDAKLILYCRKFSLRIHSDESYLSELHARSRVGGNFFFGTHNFNDARKFNRKIFKLSNIMKM